MLVENGKLAAKKYHSTNINVWDGASCLLLPSLNFANYASIGRFVNINESLKFVNIGGNIVRMWGSRLKREIQAGCPTGNFECRLCEGSNFWNEGGRKLSPYQRMKREWVKDEKFQRKIKKK